jgi:hypothetical protein
MLNSGKKICALHDKINKYSNSPVVRKKNSERNKKTITPCHVQYYYLLNNVLSYFSRCTGKDQSIARDQHFRLFTNTEGKIVC